MNIRGIVAMKLGNRVFLRPSYCECDQCPKVDLTQAQALTDLDTVQVGDKMESYTGSQWYKVSEWTPNAELDEMDQLKNMLMSELNGGFDARWGSADPKARRHLNG